MEESRSRWSSPLGRGIAVLAVLLLAVAVVSPAFSAHSNAHVKKIAKKVAKKQINKLVPGIAIEETELDRFGPFTANVGDTEKTIHTFGPFSLSLRCDDNAGNVQIRVQIATTAANSTLDSDDDSEDIFDPADVDEDVSNETDGPPGDPQQSFEEEAEFFVAGPGGTPAYHGWVAPATNFGGGHCWVRGWVLAL